MDILCLSFYYPITDLGTIWAAAHRCLPIEPLLKQVKQNSGLKSQNNKLKVTTWIPKNCYERLLLIYNAQNTI